MFQENSITHIELSWTANIMSLISLLKFSVSSLHLIVFLHLSKSHLYTSGGFFGRSVSVMNILYCWYAAVLHILFFFQTVPSMCYPQDNSNVYQELVSELLSHLSEQVEIKSVWRLIKNLTPNHLSCIPSWWDRSQNSANTYSCFKPLYRKKGEL